MIDIGRVILVPINRAMTEASVFRDTPMTPWRDHITQGCLDRVCIVHASCVRREAWCAFAAWWQSEVA